MVITGLEDHELALREDLEQGMAKMASAEDSGGIEGLDHLVAGRRIQIEHDEPTLMLAEPALQIPDQALQCVVSQRVEDEDDTILGRKRERGGIHAQALDRKAALTLVPIGRDVAPHVRA